MALDKTFDAASAEPRIYAEWEAKGCFAAGANKSRDETFTIVIPPPNVTGSLHMGHALNNTLQDILVRWHRMRGFDTLWQPGTDHAGIATQMVVERQMAEKGEKRTDFSRDDFVAKVWEWKEESGGTIINQLKRLGASCDWSRERFTMDEGLSAAVRKVFVELYNKGLIYKGKRLVNWDPHFETAISDLEVENIETPGHMWHFKYPLAGGETYEYVEKDEDGNATLRETRDYISIATTRPETMLGDGAVAVHTDDERYAPLVGKLCEIPVGPKEHRRLIPIITDDYPDPDFGSGAVKITGAHDFNDYMVAKRNGIPLYVLLDTKGAMRSDGLSYVESAERAGELARGWDADAEAPDVSEVNLVPEEYRGLDRFEARVKIVADITEEGLAVMVPAPVESTAAPDNDPGPRGAEDGDSTIETPDQVRGCDTPAMIPYVEAKPIMQPFGDRSKVVIEPMLTDQWFVDAETLAKPAREAVAKGDTAFVPKSWEKTYFNWLDNIEPWCISRQLWWGHQVPVWYGPTIEVVRAGPSLDPSEYEEQQFCAANEEEVLSKAKEYYGASFDIGFMSSNSRNASHGADGERFTVSLRRDLDVLDTWFSSALWPFSTLGWPEETPELARYYKTDVLVTGFDIIFFWVARMMMMGLEFKDEVPFHSVYINSIVVDKNGDKMSKSKGNVIDPLGLIDTYGADALRYTLASQEVQGRRQSRMSDAAVEAARNFGTKLWNAARFAEFHACERDPGFDPASVTETVNRWIIGETAKTREATDAALDAYRFNDAASGLYQHVYFLCDWYVEFSKEALTGEDGPAKEETKATVVWAIDQCLAMLHPIMPFITEELWAQTGGEGVLMHHAWPEYESADLLDKAADAEMRWTISLIETIRSVRAQMNVPAGAKIELLLTDFDMEAAQRLLRQSALIRRMARLSEAAVGNEAPAGSIVAAVEGATVNLPLADIIDLKAEGARLRKKLDKLGKEVGGLEKKLGNQGFLAKAPPDEVEKQRARLLAAQEEQAKLSAAVERIEAMG